ncbi:MAG: aminopeptidase [Anaerolineales bacterium]
MTDPRVEQMARVLVEYSTTIGPGDRVLIEGEPAAEPLIRALFKQILQLGGHPVLHLSLEGLTTLSGIDALFLKYANKDQLSFAPPFYKMAYEQFESRIRIHSQSNTKALTEADQNQQSLRAQTTGKITATQFKRGAANEFRWMTTLFPTSAYAQDADMSLEEFEDFVFRACHVDDLDSDPVAYWNKIRAEQDKIIKALNGHDKVEVHGPNCDLTLSIKDRIFVNACGLNNMPDGEVFTGPVEDSVNGWIRFSYPSAYRGNEVEGVELKFEDGRVIEAKAEKNEEFVRRMLDMDDGSRYVGEFAVGTNYGVDRTTKNILFDEKIGGSIHMALGAGYPETGNTNKSAIHWDLISDMRQGGEIVVDGEVIYRDGKFTIS